MLIERVTDVARQAREENQASSVMQSRADIDYIAMMTGVDITEEEEVADEQEL